MLQPCSNQDPTKIQPRSNQSKRRPNPSFMVDSTLLSQKTARLQVVQSKPQKLDPTFLGRKFFATHEQHEQHPTFGLLVGGVFFEKAQVVLAGLVLPALAQPQPHPNTSTQHHHTPHQPTATSQQPTATPIPNQRNLKNKSAGKCGCDENTVTNQNTIPLPLLLPFCFFSFSSPRALAQNSLLILLSSPV